MIPALRAFNPQLILLSSGFDGAHGDVGNNLKSGNARNSGTSGIDLQPSDFYWATQQIQEVAAVTCDGKVISVLEGGYGSTFENDDLKNSEERHSRRSAARWPLRRPMG